MPQTAKTLPRERADVSPPASWPTCTPGELGTALADSGWTLVEFWAPDCLFSRLLLPVRVQLQQSHGSRMTLLCCTVDSVTTGAAAFGATALPALVLFKDRKRVRRWLGAIDPSLLQYHIDTVLADARA